MVRYWVAGDPGNRPRRARPRGVDLAEHVMNVLNAITRRSKRLSHDAFAIPIAVAPRLPARETRCRDARAAAIANVSRCSVASRSRD